MGKDPTPRADALRRMREENWKRNQDLMRQAQPAKIGTKPRPMAAKPSGKSSRKRG